MSACIARGRITATIAGMRGEEDFESPFLDVHSCWRSQPKGGMSCGMRWGLFSGGATSAYAQRTRPMGGRSCSCFSSLMILR